MYHRVITMAEKLNPTTPIATIGDMEPFRDDIDPPTSNLSPQDVCARGVFDLEGERDPLVATKSDIALKEVPE